MAKRNLTVRMDDELREKLELIAAREMRTLANQITYFLAGAIEEYISQNELFYSPEEGRFMEKGEPLF